MHPISNKGQASGLVLFFYHHTITLFSFSLLTWNSYISLMLNMGGWGPLPISEASGALGSVPSELRATIYIYNLPDLHRNVSSSSIISLPILHPPLPYSHSLLDYSVSISSPPYDSTFPFLIPRVSRMGCSHHRLDRHIPGFRSATRHKFIIGLFTMYSATVFWRQAIYTPIASSPTIASADLMVGYTHVPYRLHLVPMPDIHCTSRW